MSDFVYDGTTVPDGKSDLTPLTGTPSKHVTAAEWNTVMAAIQDLRDALLLGNYHGLVSDPAAAVAPTGAMRLRNNAGTLEVSSSGGAYGAIVAAASGYNGYFTATSVGILHTNTASQNSDAFEAWYATIPQYESAVLQFDVSSDTKAYAFARTIVIQKPLRLVGGGPGGVSTYASYLTFPVNTTGIQIKSSGGVSPAFRGDNCVIENLVLVGLGYGGASSGYGILMQGRGRIKDTWVTNFGGSGVAILASSGDGNNANIWSLINVSSTSNKVHGFYIDGADANAGTAIGCNAASNLGHGFFDASFLGNTYVGCHADANVTGSYVADDVNARCLYLGCYVEGGQPLPDLGASRSTWIGGLAEGRIVGGSFVHKDGYADSFATRSAGLNRWASAGDSVILGSAPQSSLQSYLTLTSTEDGSSPLSICYLDKTKLSHKYVWYSTSGSQADGVTIASLNSENSGRLVPPGMWGFPGGHFMSTKRFDASSAAPSSARLWRIGDVRWNTSVAAGATAGWVCIASGMAGSYTEGRTATADGTTVITLSAASSVLYVGDYISCNGTVGAQITKIGEYASGTVTCAGVQAGDTITVAGTTFTAVTGAATLGTATFSKDTGDNATAASLALQVTNHEDTHGVTDFYQYIAASASTATVTFTAHVKGTSGNSYGLTSSNGTRLAVTGSGYLTGGNAGTKVTLDATVPAGSGLAISYAAASFAEFGHCVGGIPDATASPGAATQNTRRGRVAIAAAAASVVVTNSLVSATSVIHATLQTVDGTLTQILSVVPASGSFTITGNAAATGTTKVCWSLEA